MSKKTKSLVTVFILSTNLNFQLFMDERRMTHLSAKISPLGLKSYFLSLSLTVARGAAAAAAEGAVPKIVLREARDNISISKH